MSFISDGLYGLNQFLKLINTVRDKTMLRKGRER